MIDEHQMDNGYFKWWMAIANIEIQNIWNSNNTIRDIHSSAMEKHMMHSILCVKSNEIKITECQALQSNVQWFEWVYLLNPAHSPLTLPSSSSFISYGTSSCVRRCSLLPNVSIVAFVTVQTLHIIWFPFLWIFLFAFNINLTVQYNINNFCSCCCFFVFFLLQPSAQR